MRKGIFSNDPVLRNLDPVWSESNFFKFSRFASVSIPDATDTLASYQYLEHDYLGVANVIEQGLATGSWSSIIIPRGVEVMDFIFSGEFQNTAGLNADRALILKANGSDIKSRVSCLGRNNSAIAMQTGPIRVKTGDSYGVWINQRDGAARTLDVAMWFGRVLA